MKTLYLMRHAETVDALADQSDFERHLTDLGRQQAKQQAIKLLDKQLPIPQLIKSSSAWRASQTATIFASQLTQTILIELNAAMYNANSQTLLHMVNSLNDQLNCAMLVAHNFGISEFAATLVGENIRLLPPAGIVAAQFMVDNWQAIDFNLGKKLCHIVPQP